MTKDEFQKALKPLVKVCFPPTDEALSVYYEDFKKVDAGIFTRAVEEVRKSREDNRFPMPAIFEKAIAEVSSRKEYVHDDDQEVRCDKCNDIGVTLEDRGYKTGVYTVAIPCLCEAGEGWRRVWREIGSKKRQERKRSAYDKRVETLIKNTTKEV